MRRTPLYIAASLVLALTVNLGGAGAATAAVPTNLLFNPGFELADSTGAAPMYWSDSVWGDGVTATDAWSTDAHSGTHSARVDITAYPASDTGGDVGDAKWTPTAVSVTGGAYYAFSDWYKSNRSSAVSVEYWTQGQDPATTDGTWANLFSGIPSAADWTQYKTGFTMPPDAVAATFAHFIYGVGWLETDDYSMTQQPDPPGFSSPMISLTFDDGSAGFWANAWPLIQSRGLKTTQYIPTGTLNNDPDMMTPAQISTLAQDGQEIGSHSVTHPYMTTLSDSQLQTELVNSKSMLEAIPGVGTVTDFAYPYGDYDARVIAGERATGYLSGRSVEPGYNSRLDTQPFDLRVQNILGPTAATPTLPATTGTTLDEFKSWVDYARAHDYWLVLVFHEVQPDNTPLCSNPPADTDPDPCIGPYDTTVTEFTQMLDYLAQSEVVTVRDALASASAQMSPLAGKVTISPAQPSTDATLTATVSGFTDPRGDSLSYSYQWLVNGIAIAGATGPTFDLSQPGHGDPGDKIEVDVKATNGQGYTSTGVSDAVLVAATAPTGGSVPITPVSPVTGSPAPTLDRTPPSITVSSPSPGFYRLGHWLMLKFATSDSSGMAGYTATLGRVGGQPVTVDAGEKVKLTKTGRYVLRITATDKLGNTASKTMSFQVTSDRSSPSIAVLSPRSSYYHVGQRLLVKFSAKDPSGVSGTSATVGLVGHRPVKVASGRVVRPSKRGRYVLRISARDRVGNSGTKVVYFTVK